MMIEGLAMGAFAMAYENAMASTENIVKYTMSDEAFHHKFVKYGQIETAKIDQERAY